MEVFLARLTQQAMNYAIRSGIAITATYAMRQSSRLLKNVDGKDREELLALQQRLDSKIQVISPSIDMIELIAARGNTSLESAVALTKSLRWDIQALGQRLAKAAASEEAIRNGTRSAKHRPSNDAEIKYIIQDIKNLLTRIEDAVPLMNLAITTSGAKLSTNLPSTVSPSRLLQASTFLTAGDTQYSMSTSEEPQAVQIGPTFTLSVYMLFAGHVRPDDEESARDATWKEVMHKARLKVRRVPMNLYYSEGSSYRSQSQSRLGIDEYAYQVVIIEDLDDGRVHTFDANEPQPHRYDGVATAGIREILPIHQISKIFYADTGRILNISTEGETNNPVLLLKRDLNALPPRRMMEHDEAADVEAQDDESDDPFDEEQAQLNAQLLGDDLSDGSKLSRLHEESIAQEWRLPPGLDPEWIAFEVYNEDENSDDESDGENSEETPAELNGMAHLSLSQDGPSPSSSTPPPGDHYISRRPTGHPSTTTTTTVANPLFEHIRTSLSLLETLLRLTSLQQFQQQSHLSISDELLNFFLEESSSTGAGGDEQHRQRLRSDARRRVGWDPYDESPVKHRGEEYQYGWGPGSPTPYSRDDEVYSPGGGSRSFQIRSRENTPETPQRRGSPSVRRSNLRGMTPAYADSHSGK
ncbi:Uncharacterized protein PECH_001913 [Penicillium ucsense]|uniref:RanGTP-binding protein n=1 Tax=Penicillium ucsense TaxID=2839758 RepID=A0A8J8W438_9EURO|nr:Uncharacterized protein PECM_006077 [Penicillium ucsense]KAF7732193.1 Uncharacterized protein PECH_001913 [Penicillium ucsense]